MPAHTHNTHTRTWGAAKAAIEILAGRHIPRCRRYVDGVQPAQQPEAGEGAVGEAAVGLAPLVAPEGAVGLLQAGHVCVQASSQAGKRQLSR